LRDSRARRCESSGVHGGKNRGKARFASEFTAVTDVRLNEEDGRRRFVRDTRREVGIEPVALESFAARVAKLKPMIQ
jgi:hypothetical protein